MLKENISLKTYTTFQIGGVARYFWEAESAPNIKSAIEWAIRRGLSFFVLAGGSNLLVADKGFDGLAIKVKSDGKAVILSETKDPTRSVALSETKGLIKPTIEILRWCSGRRLMPSDSSLLLRMTQDKVLLHCEAGVKLSDLVKLSLAEGLSGLEWASGIPQATVGGAIWGNAGAFGKNIGNIVEEVSIIDIQHSLCHPEAKPKDLRDSSVAWGDLRMTNMVRNLKNKDCNFGYKDSIFKQNRGLVILSADLILQKKNKKEVDEEVKKVLKYRKDHHPSQPSAGSVFQNIKDEKIILSRPEFAVFQERKEIPAGWLIEQCGLKGKTIGGAQISTKHTNFIVNIGIAKASDVKQLIQLAKQAVWNKFAIALEEEIQYLGF